MYDKKIIYTAPMQGENDTLSPMSLSETEAPLLENFVVGKRKLLDKVSGYIKDGSPFPDNADSFIRMLLNLKRGTTSDVLLLAAQDNGNTNATYKVDFKKTSGDGNYAYIGHTAGTSATFTNGSTAVTGSGTAWLSHIKAGDKIKATAHAESAWATVSLVNSDTSITLAANYTGATVTGAYIARIILNKSFVPRGVVFNNKAVITNGSDTPMTYDNTTLDLITDADCPKGKFIETHKNRVFIAATSAGPSNIYWSAVNDVSSWDAAAYEQVFPQDNGNIAAIKSFGDSLVVLKDNGNIYQVFGNFDESDTGEVGFIRKVDATENIGTISERTPVVHGGFLYFMAQTGIYRMDSRGVVEKISYSNDSFLETISTALGPSQSKTYTYDSKTQWDTGTHSGTEATTAGVLRPFFDKLTLSDATKQDGGVSCAMDTSNNVYVAYLDNMDASKIKFTKWLATDKTNSTPEVVVDVAGTVVELCLDVSPSGLTGIAYIYLDGSGSYHLQYIERAVDGTWGTDTNVDNADFTSVSLKFRSDNEPRIATTYITGGTYVSRYHRRVTGTWSRTNVSEYGHTQQEKACLFFTSGNVPRILTTNGFSTPGGTTNNISTILASDDGFTWASGVDYHAVSLDGHTRPIGMCDSTDAVVIVYGDASTGKIMSRKPTFVAGTITDTATTAEIDDLNNNLIGATVYDYSSDETYCYHYSGTTEKYNFENTSDLSNTSSVLDTSGLLPSARCMDNNGPVFATAFFGANANEVIVRRLSFRAVYYTPQTSDSTLTAWGTYEVADQISTGHTLTHEIATNTTDPVSSYRTIVTGQLIDADSANVFVRARITFVITSFAESEVGSVIMNYTGAGVDARQPLGFSFNNELFFAMCTLGSSANNKVFCYDINGAPYRTTWPVASMERFKQKLYAGLATKGDLIILQQGKNFDGVAYSADCQYKEDFLGEIEIEKDLGKIYVLYEVQTAGTLEVSYRLDSFKTPGGSSWTSTSIDMTKDGFAEIVIGQKARTLQLRVQNSAINNSVGCVALVVTYRNLHQR